MNTHDMAYDVHLSWRSSERQALWDHLTADHGSRFDYGPSMAEMLVRHGEIHGGQLYETVR